MRYCIIVASLLLALTLFADRRSMLFSRVPPAAGGGGAGSPAVESFGSTNWGAWSTQLSTNIVTCSGSGRALFVFSGKGSSDATTFAVTNITYNGVALTRLLSTNDGAWTSCTLWYLVNPASGANALVINANAHSGTQNYLAWVNVTNANQSTTVGTAVANSGSGTAPSVTLAADTGDLMIAGVSTDSQASLSAATGAFVTSILNVESDIAFGISTNAGGVSVAMSYTTAADGYSVGGVAIKKP